MNLYNVYGTTTVINLSTGKKQRLDLSQYTKGAVLKPIYQEHRKPDNVTIFMGIITTLMSVIIIYAAFAKDYKRFRFRRVIAVTAREASSNIQVQVIHHYIQGNNIAASETKRDTTVTPQELP
ncbi:MAG: hypothetical protein D3906_01135 [Candidatus Electrothrix sp. AUS1_2]|nr:hypothetical protein [Candidatus Electrothrix sp. AUS1_2]